MYICICKCYKNYLMVKWKKKIIYDVWGIDIEIFFFLEWLKEDDVVIVDRGFWDVVIFMEENGF